MRCELDTVVHAHPEVEPRDWATAVHEQLIAERRTLTPARRAIVEWIAAQRQPFIVDSLIADLTTAPRPIGPATVYRMLSWLHEHGWLTRLYVANGDRITRSLPGHHHLIICVRCAATVVFGGCSIHADTAIVDAISPTGFTAQWHVLQLYGLCQACREAISTVLTGRSGDG
ncbi:MAG: transcriptional repressor [Dehalococcoidia bacterium]|nr:transcriptional repressor [Dehalococcoidia bacterium]